LLLSALFAIVGYGLFAFAGAWQLWGLMLGGIILLGLAFLSRPAISALTAESAQAGQHGSAFSFTMVAWLVPGILAPMLGGWAAEQWGYTTVFPILILFEIVTFGLVWRYLRETRAGRDAIRWRDLGGALVRALAPPKGLGAFFLATASDSFAWSLGWGLINGMLVKTHGFTVEQLGVLASVMALAWATMQMPIGRYVDRHALKPVMIFSESLGIPLMLIGITQSRFEMFVAAQFLFALTAATWVPVVNTYMTRAVPAHARSEAFGRLNAFRGTIAFPASWLGGLLYDWGGMTAPLLSNLIGSCVVITILILFVREPAAT
jgi:MFS family permease